MNKILATVLFALVTAHIEAQQPADAPKLVVGITVDQLRADYLEAMLHAFGEDGIKRLIDEGTSYDAVEYELPQLDRASAMATLYTGTYPTHHGILGNRVYNVALRRDEASLHDEKMIGNYTNTTLSPKNILTSTLTDELKIASDGWSRVCAIAPTYEAAIIAGGHAANSVFWIDDKNGKWASTTFYREVPVYVENHNLHNSLSQRIDTMTWQPLLQATEYTYFPYLEENFLFKYNFSRYKEQKYVHLKTSPQANREVTQLAQLFIEKGEYGKHHFPDMLNIGYTLAAYQGKSVQEVPIEVQDAYLRLDKEIAALLKTIDSEVGMENAFVFLTSTGYFEAEGKAQGIHNIPTGEFYPYRAAALLNTYLMALYGQESWVTGYYNNQIFLNRELIIDKQVDSKEIQTKAAEFLIEMTGVHDVITSHQLLHGNWNSRLDKYYKAYHRKLSGDLLIEVQPGWEIVHEDTHNTRRYVRLSAIPTPLIFWGNGVKAQKITRPIKATAITPTVARRLRIRSPNAAEELPLPEID